MSDEPSELELPTRRTIYQRIVDTPGIHFRALFDDLDFAKGTLQYHLRWLAEEALIDVQDGDDYTRYYAADSFDEDDQTVMGALRRTIARRILAYLVSEGPLTTTDIAERLEKSQSTISWHLSNLVDAGLVEKERATPLAVSWTRSTMYPFASPFKSSGAVASTVSPVIEMVASIASKSGRVSRSPRRKFLSACSNRPRRTSKAPSVRS